MHQKFIYCIILFFGWNVGAAQVHPIESFFTNSAIHWGFLDSNNYILDEAVNKQKLVSILDSEFSFTIEQAEHPENIVPIDTLINLNGLHAAEPFWDTVLQEVKGEFSLDGTVKNWFAYKCKSQGDTNTAFLIIPGYGAANSWYISTADTNNYHNIPFPIRKKCALYGDVFTIVKPNEEFRAIWKTINNWNLRLGYQMMGPYTNFKGHNWAANFVIECIATVKYLKLKYDKVIVLGLSNGGIISLISALEGNADGCVVATGLAIDTYDPFPVPNYENPLYYRMNVKYSLDSIKQRLGQTNKHFLFGFGDADFYAAYEYATHSLEDTLLSTGNACHLDFNYNYSGHHFPIHYLDTFVNRVIADTCALLKESRNATNQSQNEKNDVGLNLKHGNMEYQITADVLKLMGLDSLKTFKKKSLEKMVALNRSSLIHNRSSQIDMEALSGLTKIRTE